MGTVKYTGPVASFHCPTSAEIRSLKVHFSPKQEGSGTPSPENVREIVGWDEVTVQQSGINLFNPDTEWFVQGGRYYSRFINNDTALFRMDLIEKNTTVDVSGCFIGFALDPSNIELGYCWALRNGTIRPVANRTNRAGAKPLQYLSIYPSTIETLTKILARYEVRIVLNDVPETAPFKPYQGFSTTNYEFGVLGKNKLPITANMEIKSVNTGYDKTLQRDMTPGILYPNVSANNYWLGTTAKTFVQEVQNGSITFQANDGSYGIGTIVPVQPQATYTISYTTSGNQVRMRIGCYNADGYFTGTHQIINNGASFTIPNDVYHVIIVATPNSDYYNQLITVSNLQLELGSTATTYEPYNPNHTVYGGWVDLISGEIASTYIHCKIKDLPGEWNYRSGNNRFQITLTDDYANAASSGGIWTHFATSEVYKTSTSNGYGNKQIATYIDKHIYIRDDDFEGDVEEFLSSIGDTYITYELAESTTYSLSPTSMQTFLGTNNVWSNADYVEVEYDLHETQDILARKQFIMASQPHVEEASGAIVTFNTDMAAKLKECKVHFGPVQDLHGYSKPWVGGSGKNLFNINATEQNPSDTTAVNTTQRIFTPGTYAVGASYSNYWHDTNVTSYTIEDDTITVTSFSGYGIGFAFSVTPGTSYVASATVTTITTGTTASGSINIAYYDVEGNFINMGYNGSNLNGVASVAPEDATVLVVIFRGPNKNTTVAFSNIQLEKGSAATTYEPYENICQISGWENIEINQSGKNLNNNWLKPEGITASGYYNGYSSWAKDWAVPASLIGVTLRYSAFIDNTGTTDTRDAYLHIWTKDKDGIYIRTNATSATHLNPGESGRLVASITPRDTEAFISCGLTMPAGCKASEPLLEIGSIETDYEPYTGTTIPITFPSEAGTVYGGYVDLATGEVWKTCNKIVLDGDNIQVNNGSYESNGNYGAGLVYVEPTGKSVKYKNGLPLNLWCENIPLYIGVNTIPEPPYVYAPLAGKLYFVVYVAKVADHPELSDKTARKNYVNEWLKQNPITLVYELETPTIVGTLSPSQLKSLRGINNVWSNSNGDVQVKFWKH